MNEILTAEDFLHSKGCGSKIQEKTHFFYDVTKEDLIEFAKIYVIEALKKASEEANMLGETQHNNGAPDTIQNFVYVSDSNGPDYGFIVNKSSILESYSLENIK